MGNVLLTVPFQLLSCLLWRCFRPQRTAHGVGPIVSTPHHTTLPRVLHTLSHVLGWSVGGGRQRIW